MTEADGRRDAKGRGGHASPNRSEIGISANAENAITLKQAEGFHGIREKFLSPVHIGPKSVADFEEITDREARDLRQRDAFERVDHLLAQLGVA